MYFWLTGIVERLVVLVQLSGGGSLKWRLVGQVVLYNYVSQVMEPSDWPCKDFFVPPVLIFQFYALFCA